MSEEESSMGTRSSFSSFVKILSSYNSNVLLAALVFLLLVVLFVLLLHFYARFFWSPSYQDFDSVRRRRRRRNRRRTVTTTRIIPSVPLDGGVSVPPPSATTNDVDKGLDSSVISSIPLFVYEEEEEEEEEGDEEEEECVICLGLWEVGDIGRKLRNCGHGFHVECIDMWLSSHSTCPLCRSPVLSTSNKDNLKLAVNGVGDEPEGEEEAEVRLQLFPAEEDENNIDSDRRISLYDEEEINGGGSRGERRSMSMTSSASRSLMRMLSTGSNRSERNKVFLSPRQDSSS